MRRTPYFCIDPLFPMPYRVTDVRTIFDGWTKFLTARLRTAAGIEVERVILDHGRAAAVLPYDPQRRVALLVTQPRAPLLYLGEAAEMLEVIAGRAGDEDAAAAARREAMEEAGLNLRDLEEVADCWPTPGISTERVALFLASYAETDRIGSGGGADGEHEDISITEMPLRELEKLAKDGKLADMKTLVLVQALLLRRPDLFV
ncbi:MAG TPA: NUDIX domain-containing protein [Xanthobacteraceae bacterium]|nr:NUDIX domain-containing protein [Xanthobacteraceae bacterium]